MADLSRHKIRSILTISAVAISVSLVVAMTSGFTSLKSTAGKLLGGWYESVDVAIRPEDDRGLLIDQRTLDALGRDRRVQALRAKLIARALLAPRTDGPGRQAVKMIGMIRDDADPVLSQLTEGKWFESKADSVAVLESGLAQRLKLSVGGKLTVPTPTADLVLTIVGIVEKPDVLRIDLPEVYLPLPTLQQWAKMEGQVNSIDVDLVNAADAEDFIAAWKSHQGESGVKLRLESVATQTRMLENNLKGLELLSYFGGSLSMVAASFIIFSTLAMGVTERSRILAMLRAIGARKGLIVRLVMAEGLMLGLIAAPAGLLLGWLWIWLLVWWKPHVFLNGVQLSAGGMIYGALGSILTATLAAALPAWNASRLDVLEALTASSKQRKPHHTLCCALAGAALMAVDPLVSFTQSAQPMTHLYAHVFAGLPCMMAGLFLLAPMIVLLAERIGGAIAARLAGIEPELLRQQLSGGLWRTAGTAAGLMVGLTAMTAMQTHGRSLIGGWKLPNKFPDLLMFAPLGLSDDQIANVRKVEGLNPDQFMGVALASPQLSINLLDLGGMIQTPNATVMFGLDIDKTFGTMDGKVPRTPGMVGLEFVEGDQERARRLLKRGRHVVVSENYKQLKGVRIGDKLKLKTPVNGEVEYTVAGVAKASGIEMLIRFFNMRQEFDRWTAASVITSVEDVRRDFGMERLFIFAGNVIRNERGRSFEDEKPLRRQLANWGLLVADAKRLKEKTDEGMERILNILSLVAIAAIGVASLGVTNAVMASVRSRRWQFGVLRALGLTRSALLRMIVVEAVLIGVIGSVMGVSGGLIIGADANHLSGRITGYFPPYVLALEPIIYGVGITLAVAVLASLWPAFHVARAETLGLLKAGRAAA